METTACSKGGNHKLIVDRNLTSLLKRKEIYHEEVCPQCHVGVVISRPSEVSKKISVSVKPSDPQGYFYGDSK